MMNWQSLKKEIEVLIEPIIIDEGLSLYKINKINDFGGPGIEILVSDTKNLDKVLDFEILSRLTEKLSLVLDEKLNLSDQYYLIVGTRGIEHKIISPEELIKAIDKFIAVDLIEKNSQKTNHFEGFLRNYDSETKLFLLEFYNKGQKKKVTFSWEQAYKIRHAVKV